jgi:7-cyano-7-deazaguanine synthase in queuosine biosynthesis
MRNSKIYPERIICFDFDGTLTKTDIYPNIELTNVNWDMAQLIRKLYSRYTILINSSRDTIYYNQIYIFLKENNIPYHQIHLKSKPTADLYIDDKSLFHSSRHLEAFIESYFSVNLDDYLQKLVSNSFSSDFASNIANVPENPIFREIEDDNYMIILPITGGMDSTTLWKMATQAGERFAPYYIDMGQKYAPMEIDIIKSILKIDPKILNLKLDFQEFSHILLGRNAAIILKLAQEFKDNDWWGEIWFGNLQGESPILDGDKSKRFFNDMNALLVHHGYDVRVVNPLMCLDKPDLVAYWKELDDIETLKQTKSCFSEKYFQCGHCQSCFRKWAAFKYHGIDISHQFHEIKFDPYIEKYQKRM